MRLAPRRFSFFAQSAGYLIKMLLKTGGKLDVRFRQPTKAQAQKLIKDSRAA